MLGIMKRLERLEDAAAEYIIVSIEDC